MLHNYSLNFLLTKETEQYHARKWFSFARKKFEEDFGTEIASKCTPENFHTITKQFYAYTEAIRHGIENTSSLFPRDLFDLLKDNNLGNGKILCDLVKLLTSKENAITACIYHHPVEGSALLQAATKANKDCIELITNKIKEENAEQIDTLLDAPNMFGITARNYVPITLIISHESDHDAITSSDDQDSRGSTLLHGAALSGSPAILELVLREANYNIQQLYTRNRLGRTPAYYAASNGSLAFLKQVLALSTLSAESECLPSSITPQINTNVNLLDLAVEKSDLLLFDCLLKWLEENDNLKDLKKIYCEESVGIFHILNSITNRFYSITRYNKILFSNSGAMFYLLNRYINFSKDCALMQHAARMGTEIKFTTRCLLSMHVKKLEHIEQNNRPIERPAKRRRM